MKGSRTLQPVLGESTGSAVVALLSVASFVAYLVNSKAVAEMVKGWSYLSFTTRSLIAAPHLHVFAFPIATSVVQVLTFIAFVASCIAVGLLVARGMRGTSGAAPMGWVAGLSAAVVPTMLVVAVGGWPDGRGLLRNAPLVLAQMPLVLVAWLWSRTQATRPVSPFTALSPADDDLSTWWVTGPLLVAVPFALAALINGFSGIHGFDSFSEHLAVPARWLSQGRIERDVPNEIVSFYPGNFELLIRWMLSLGSDRFGFLVSYASSAACVWVIYRLCVELGQTRTAARISALSAASLQVLAYQSTVVYSDSFTALCLLLATWLLLIIARMHGAGNALRDERAEFGMVLSTDARGRGDAAIDGRLTIGLGLAFGLALGAKYSAGPPGIVLGLAWMYYAWRDSWDVISTTQERWRLGRFARHLALLSAGVAPPMAYWYLRNLVEQRNPLYPLSVAGLPGISLEALIATGRGPTKTWDQLILPWSESIHGLGYETGLGPIVASVVLLGVFATPFYKRRPGTARTLACVLLIGTTYTWLRTGTFIHRYGLFQLLLSFVFVGELWMAYGSGLLRAVTGISIVSTMLSLSHEMLGGFAYEELMQNNTPVVPAVIDSLPPSRILNTAGEPSGYYAMGHDFRHRVVRVFQEVKPSDVAQFHADYLLLPAARENEFTSTLPLTLVGRAAKPGQAPTSLWRVLPTATPITP